MAATTPDLSVLYDKKRYKVITSPVEDGAGVIRCARQRPLGYYVNALKEALKTNDTVTIMGAGKAVATAEAIAHIAVNIEAKLHRVAVKGTEKHSFTFESKDDAKTQVVNERDVEFTRIQIIKDSKITAADKKKEGYTAPPETVSEETLTAAIRKARTDLQAGRPRTQSRRKPAAKKEGEEGEKKERRPNNRKPRAEGEKADGEKADGENKRRGAGRPRGPRKPQGEKAEKKQETA